MDFNQKINSIQIKPRKIRLITRQIKHWPLVGLRERLNIVNRDLNQILVKGLDAAIDRIKTVNLDPATFNVKRIECYEGMKLKRRRISSRGKSKSYRHQRSGVSLVIGQPRSNENKIEAQG